MSQPQPQSDGSQITTRPSPLGSHVGAFAQPSVAGSGKQEQSSLASQGWAIGSHFVQPLSSSTQTSTPISQLSPRSPQGK